MLETPHVIVGAAIATKLGNPALAIPLAFGSHFILEKVPHWNPHINTEKRTYGKITEKSKNIIIADTGLALISGFYIASRTLPNTGHFWTVILASFFAVLPDVIEGPYYFFDFKNGFIDKWIKFQKSLQNDTSVIPGLITQVITVAAALVWIGV